MPGSKRRALKKLLSPHSEPSGTGASSPASDIAIPALSPSPSNGSQPITITAPQAPQEKKRTSSLRSSFSLSRSSLKHGKPSATSIASIASDPNNYLTDQQLQQDLAVEEMIEREDSIGTGDARQADGVGELHVRNGLETGMSVPPPAGAELGSSPSRQLSRSPPAPPPKTGLFHGGALTSGFGGAGKKKSSKQKFEERQARKKEALLASAPPSDPAWTAQLEKERQEEIRIITDACSVLGRELYEIAPDGHCMYAAIADQLVETGVINPDDAHYTFTRRAASNFMLKHSDDFMPFLASVDGEDTAAAASHEGMMTEKEFKTYCRNVAETGDWGGEPEIQALSRAFNVPIHVIQAGPPTIVSHGGEDDTFGGALTPEQSKAAGDRVVRISYHRRMYGLGEHYNSLRKA